jgi:hypothetical protein
MCCSRGSILGRDVIVCYDSDNSMLQFVWLWLVHLALGMAVHGKQVAGVEEVLGGVCRHVQAVLWWWCQGCSANFCTAKHNAIIAVACMLPDCFNPHHA